jgi:hypothetical protein
LHRAAISEVWTHRGGGVVSYSILTPGVELGVGGAARRRLHVKVLLPSPEGGEPETSYLTVGVIAPANLRVPVRWRISLDNTGIASVLKPQISVDIDDGQVYYKLIYDVSDLAKIKFKNKTIHVVGFAYDGIQPIFLADLSLVSLFKLDGARSSASFFSGAHRMEPGDKVIVYSRLGEYMGGVRRALASVYIPSPLSRLRFVAGGSIPTYGSGPGMRVLETEIPYKGGEVPVAIVYEETDTPIYPRVAVAGDIVVVENYIEGPSIEIRGVETRREDGKQWVSVKIANKGGEPCDKITISVLRGDTPLLQKEHEGLGAGETRETTLPLPGAREGEKLVLRVTWRAKGFPLARDTVFTVKP